MSPTTIIAKSIAGLACQPCPHPRHRPSAHLGPALSQHARGGDLSRGPHTSHQHRWHLGLHLLPHSLTLLLCLHMRHSEAEE